MLTVILLALVLALVGIILRMSVTIRDLRDELQFFYNLVSNEIKKRRKPE